MISDSAICLSKEFFRALAFAAQCHRYQRRNGFDKLPYINHLVKVVEALISIGEETDEDLLIAAALHDIVEDEHATLQELANHFGSKISNIVAELSDDMTLPYNQRKQLQIEKASSLSLPARKIRIADKASNIQDIFNYPIDWSLQKKKAYLENSKQIVDQIRNSNVKLEAWFDEQLKWANAIILDIETTPK